MLEGGYNATTLQSICELANVTKGGFFHHFSSKKALLKELLTFYWSETLLQLADDKAMLIKNPSERLLAIIDFFESILRIPNRAPACLLGNITQEVALTSDEIRATCSAIFADWIAALKQVIEEINTKEGTRIDSQGLAELIVATVEGAFILVKATKDITAGSRLLQHLKQYIKLSCSKT